MNELQQNAMASTARALKEHFILERIAEEREDRGRAEDDYDTEIELIAEQADESPRRVRARLEKKGLMDTLRNQIIERKVIELIESQAEFSEVPYVAAEDRFGRRSNSPLPASSGNHPRRQVRQRSRHAGHADAAEGQGQRVRNLPCCSQDPFCRGE